jgi:hypothetical protein
MDANMQKDRNDNFAELAKIKVVKILPINNLVMSK